jgi:hypothetical protein
MGEERDKLKKNPNIFQLPRNTNPVVRITRTTKRTKAVEKSSKNRDKKVRPPEPMNTNITISKEIR